MRYRQLTSEERYMISALRRQEIHAAAIARNLGRHRSKLSPEQIAGHLRRHQIDTISHETIYRYVHRDRGRGRCLYRHLRLAKKQRRKRYRSVDSRGQLPGRRSIHDRPQRVDRRVELGHWEADTVMGKYGTKPCIVTLVERKSGFVLIGKMQARTASEANRAMLELIERHRAKIKTITADNGTEFHSYEEIERRRRVRFCFATPYHSWERGTNENTNGLIRQYLPKGASLVRLTQAECDAIADQLNHRPRKRHGFKTPNQILFPK